MSSKDDVARASEWPVFHWDRVVDMDDHGEIARSGAIKNNKIWVDAKPVKPPDAVKKLKEDKEAMIRRIEQQKPKGGVHLKQVHNIIQPLKNDIMNLKSKIADLNNSVDDIKEHSGIGGRRKKRTKKRRRKRTRKRRKSRRRKRTRKRRKRR